MLVVLDNFEQLLEGAPVVAELLAASNTLRVVVTSRSPLHVEGEQELPVPSLGLPPAGVEPPPEALAEWESTSLFLARARAVAPTFTPDADEGAVVAEIVRRLEGLPLAIELAASRVKVLPVANILARLDDSLELLVGGRRDAPVRHQTLRATIAWSHDLLSGNARRLLAVLGVFRGSATLGDLERVYQSVGPSLPVLDALEELVDHSLVRLQPDSAEPRYTMLEAVREFALDQLEASVEGGQVRRAPPRTRRSTRPPTTATSMSSPPHCRGGRPRSCARTATSPRSERRSTPARFMITCAPSWRQSGSESPSPSGSERGHAKRAQRHTDHAVCR